MVLCTYPTYWTAYEQSIFFFTHALASLTPVCHQSQLLLESTKPSAKHSVFSIRRKSAAFFSWLLRVIHIRFLQSFFFLPNFFFYKPTNVENITKKNKTTLAITTRITQNGFFFFLFKDNNNKKKNNFSLQRGKKQIQAKVSFWFIFIYLFFPLTRDFFFKCSLSKSFKSNAYFDSDSFSNVFFLLSFFFFFVCLSV